MWQRVNVSRHDNAQVTHRRQLLPDGCHGSDDVTSGRLFLQHLLEALEKVLLCDHVGQVHVTAIGVEKPS